MEGSEGEGREEGPVGDEAGADESGGGFDLGPDVGAYHCICRRQGVSQILLERHRKEGPDG